MTKPKNPARKVTELRLANFLEMFREFESESPGRGVLTRMAAKTGLTANYLSQIKAGTKPIGPKNAAVIESAMGYPPGWLDEMHDELELKDTAETLFVRRMLRGFRAASRQGQEAMIENLDEMLKRMREGNFP